MRPYASYQHYMDHMAPVLPLVEDVDAALVASYTDVRAARAAGERYIALMQHGIGQSYSDNRAHYPGGEDNDDVGLFLCPNEHSADRWRAAYPKARTEVVGSPRIETLPLRQSDYHEPDGRPVVAFSFHWDGYAVPESRSAWPMFQSRIAELRAMWQVIGHAHPRRQGMRRAYDRMGVEFVPTFDEVCQRADLYVCDNSSTLYEFASTGRPVVVLNAPMYRENVNHGLRFWEASKVGINVWDPDVLAIAIEHALEDSDILKGRRGAALSIVYSRFSGAAQAAADAIHDWARLERVA